MLVILVMLVYPNFHKMSRDILKIFNYFIFELKILAFQGFYNTLEL